MTIFNESDIKNLFDDNLKKAKNLLKKLEVFCGDEPKFNGLDGWVLEKTIQHCIREELKKKRITHNIVEQFGLGGKSKVDLKVGNVAIEIKKSGFYDSRNKVSKQCRDRRRAANKNGASRYVVMSLKGTHSPLWKTIRRVIGRKNTFCLFFKNKQQKDEWKRFIDLLCSQKAN